MLRVSLTNQNCDDSVHRDLRGCVADQPHQSLIGREPPVDEIQDSVRDDQPQDDVSTSDGQGRPRGLRAF